MSSFDILPAELIHYILSLLPASDLACVSATCRMLAEHGASDVLWARLVNSNLPQPISNPGPFKSFRRLYLAHLSYWFIPKHKIWFSDHNGTGNLILARYDNRRGVIEAYRVIADRGSPQMHLWGANIEVMVPSFDPHVCLWLDDPVLLLRDPDPSSPIAACQDWKSERRMAMATDAQHLFNSLLLCSDRKPEGLEATADRVWPPQTIPRDNWVFRDPEGHVAPENASEVADWVFRIRRWAHFRFGLSPVVPTDNEAIFTYATLDPELYTPTREKPYQGIWVGDYSAHGCEFLLFFQRDRGSSMSGESTDADEDENEDEAVAGGVIQKGALEAVKLTGDPNVPRGEVTFTASDIGPKGLVRVAEEDPFKGARIVRSHGHVAGIGFRDGKSTDIWRPTHLLTIHSLDRLVYQVSTHPCFSRLHRALLGGDGSRLLLPTRGH